MIMLQGEVSVSVWTTLSRI